MIDGMYDNVVKYKSYYEFDKIITLVEFTNILNLFMYIIFTLWI